MLSQWQPDVILLDLMMPIMDGWVFLAKRLISPALLRIPVVVMSAALNLPALSSSVNAHLPKPFSIDELLGQVESLIA